MGNPFEISSCWRPGEMGRTPEEHTRAEIGILVNDVCVTEVEDRLDNTTRQVVRSSALWLAWWLAGNWWRLRWEPETAAPDLDWQLSHNLATAGGGYLWPDLSFGSDGDTVVVRSRSAAPSNVEPIRYLRDYVGVIPVGDFERVVDDFIADVLSRLSGSVSADSDLAELWEEVAAERNQLELYDLRKLEALLGYDPGEAPATLIADLQKERERYGAGAVQELAVVAKDQATEHLRVVGTRVQSWGVPAQVLDHNLIRQQYAGQINPLAAPWQRGAEAARIARTVWNLDSGPVRTSTLADLFGLALTEIEAGDLPFSAGWRDDAEPELRVAFNQQRLTGRRFALARLAGDYLIAPLDERLLPATSSKTSRQKLQRSFAQEFLCPLNDLLDFLGASPPDDDDIDDAAAHFEVSPLTIKATLVNKGIMEREALGEWAV